MNEGDWLPERWRVRSLVPAARGRAVRPRPGGEPPWKVGCSPRSCALACCLALIGTRMGRRDDRSQRCDQAVRVDACCGPAEFHGAAGRGDRIPAAPYEYLGWGNPPDSVRGPRTLAVIV